MSETHSNLATWKNRSEVSIAQGALTNSKKPSCFVKGVYPTHLVRGKGAYVWDDRGRRYIDFICALGTNLFGYANRDYTTAVMSALELGVLYSLGSTKEVEFAERVQSLFPFVERIKILKSGSEGCNAAIRIARAASGKDIVFSDGYHGWSDEFVSLTPPALGVPLPRPWILPISYLSIPGILEKAAAVIIEPVITDYSIKRIEELKTLRELCTRHKIALIFDETITAFRFPNLCVAKEFGIEPDLIVFGKALANGLPISVVGGKAKLMDSDYFVSTTFAGDTTAITAAMLTLQTAKAKVPAIVDQAERFQKAFNEINKELIYIDGYPMRGVFKAKDDLTKALFFQEMVKAGVLFGSSFFWCEPHAEDAQFVLKLCRENLTRIANGAVMLEGEMPVTPFAQKQREKKT